MKNDLCLAMVIFAGVISTAQTLPLRPIELNKAIVIDSEWNQPLMGQVRCDDRGRTYFREYDRGNIVAPPVVRVDASGDRITRFSLRDGESMQKASSSDFVLSNEGRLYQFAQVGRFAYIVSFSDEGKQLSRVKLERPVYVSHAVAFSDGTFLVTGSKPDVENPTKHKPFTGIVATDGKFIAGVPDAQLDSSEHEAASQDDALNSIYLGSVEAGSDGFAYLVRRTLPVRVFVLNSRGEVIRTLKIEQPGDEHLKPIAIHEAHGQVAVLFVEDSEQPDPDAVLLIADAMTGETLRKYDAAPAGLAFACFTGDAAAFLGARDNKLAIKWFDLR